MRCKRQVRKTVASSEMMVVTRAVPGHCARIDCNNPVSGRAKYCSNRCSAAVRNRRYYRTVKGREKKRELARWYFRRHRDELYERRARRFQRLCNAEIAADMRFHTFNDAEAAATYVQRYIAPEARGRVAFWHDFHPARFHDWHGRVRWEYDFLGGMLKPYWVRGPYREEIALAY